MLGKTEGRRRRGSKLNGHEFEQALGNGQESLACCSPWGHKELDTAELLNRKIYISECVCVCVCVCVCGGSDGKASVCNAGDPGSIPGLGRSPGEGNGSPLQYSCLENPMDSGAW